MCLGLNILIVGFYFYFYFSGLDCWEGPSYMENNLGLIIEFWLINFGTIFYVGFFSKENDNLVFNLLRFYDFFYFILIIFCVLGLICVRKIILRSKDLSLLIVGS